MAISLAMKYISTYLFFLFFFVPESISAENPMDDDTATPIQAILISDSEIIGLGQEYRVGVLFNMSPGWHIYWNYPGNTGKPTRIAYTSDTTHTKVLESSYPTPGLFDPDPIENMSFGYKESILIPAKAMSYAKPQSDTVTIQANVSWLACKETCIPGNADLAIDLKIGKEPKPSKWNNLFVKTYLEMPTDSSGTSARLESFHLENGEFKLTFALDGFVSVDRFIPKWIENSTCQIKSYQINSQDNRNISASMTFSGVDCLPGAGGIVVGRLDHAQQDQQKAYTLDIKSIPPKKKPADQKPTDLSRRTTPETHPASHMPPEPRQSIGWMLVFAFLGGLLLNIMPCVIPVVVPKLLHVVRSVRDIENPRQKSRLLWQNALAYSAGVLATMLSLSLFVVLLKHLGHEAGWGFQFQNPWFLVFMISLLLLAGLGMLKTFSLKSSRHADNLKQIKKIRRSNPLLESFFTGLLVTFLGTPCTAPFLGPALGYAFSQSSPMIVLFLFIVGLGLASPFLLLGVWTGWTRLLPSKVTDRYDRVMRIMAFLFFATALWLLGVLADGYGVAAMKNMLWFMLSIALCAWLFGLWTHDRQSNKTRLIILIPLFVLLTVIGAWILEFPKHTQAVSPNVYTSPVGIDWQPFSESKLKDLRREGRSIFIDFTAEWCLNCKANEKLIIERDETKKLIDRLNIATLKADHTRFDPVVMRWLKRHRRAGVPMYLVFPACKPDENAILLPEILTRETLNQALIHAGPSEPGCS